MIEVVVSDDDRLTAVDDVAVSALDVPDPEFDPLTGSVVWQEPSGALNIARIDAEAPALGPLTVVDTDLAPIAVTLNGPEWAYGAVSGSRVVYTRLRDGVPTLAVAELDADRSWVPHDLALGSDRMTPYGSPLGSPVAKAVYWHLSGEVRWRVLANPASEQRLTGYTVARGGWRWLSRAQAFLALASVGGVQQVLLVDTETATASPLTSGSVSRRNGALWTAPEFGLRVLVEQLGFTVLRVSVDDLVGGWTPTLSWTGPSAYPYFNSLEVFLASGKSYLAVSTFSATEETPLGTRVTGPSRVWVLGIDPAAPFARAVDDGSIMQRSEPEPYLSTSGWVVFYNEHTADGRRVLRRARTGLTL